MKNMSKTNRQRALKMQLQKFADPVSVPMFQLITAPEIASYWTERNQEKPPFLGDILFPADKQLGMEVSWFLGEEGAPKMLRPHAFDAEAIPRDRKEFETILTDMGLFSESYYIDEKLRQELLKVQDSKNPEYINNVLRHVFNDVEDLINGAAVTREVMRMQLLTTGKIDISGNGHAYDVDYGFTESHKGKAKVSWTDNENCDPIEDLENAIDVIVTDTGVRPERAILNSVTLRQLRNSRKIGLNLYPNGGGHIRLGRADVLKYLSDELGLTVEDYSKKYTTTAGTTVKYIPDNVVTLLPSTELGKTRFGTTPAEADLMTGAPDVQVSLVDTGVSISTSKKFNPVRVDTVVAQLVVPTFEKINQVFILNTIAQP